MLGAPKRECVQGLIRPDAESPTGSGTLRDCLCHACYSIEDQVKVHVLGAYRPKCIRLGNGSMK